MWLWCTACLIGSPPQLEKGLMPDAPAILARLRDQRYGLLSRVQLYRFCLQAALAAME